MSAFLASIFLFYAIGFAQNFQVPLLSGPVVDQADVLSSSQEQTLAGYISQARSQGGPQIQVLIVRDLSGITIEEASIKVVDAWKLGSKKTDDGILLLIAPKERRLRIEVGRGLEGAITDLLSRRVIDQVIGPRFRTGDYAGGILQGIQALQMILRRDGLPSGLDDAAAGNLESAASAATYKPAKHPGISSLFLILIFIVVLGVSRRSGLHSSRRGFGGFPGGGGWTGGGGGGWKGGGGGFSGGGSSGSW